MSTVGSSEVRRCDGTLVSSGARCGARVLQCTNCGRTGCNDRTRGACDAQAFVLLECTDCRARGAIAPARAVAPGHAPRPAVRVVSPASR